MKNPLLHSIAAVVFALLGASVFAIRLGHSGPYAIPTGLAPVGAVICIAISGYLLWSGKPKWTGAIAIALGIIASLAPIYSIVGESEEVISLYAIDAAGQPVDLRLWIVDREGVPWVGMSREKATSNNLHGSQLKMLRAGEILCVRPTLFDKDRETVSEIHRMKVAKYTAAQIAAAVGMYPKEAGANTVALRLDPC